MARKMTEQELWEFYEFNRRLSRSHRAKGELFDARHFAGMMRHLERHLHQFDVDRENIGGDAKAWD